MGPGQRRGAWLYGWGRSNPQEWPGGREQVDSGAGKGLGIPGTLQAAPGAGAALPEAGPAGLLFPGRSWSTSRSHWSPAGDMRGRTEGTVDSHTGSAGEA